MKKILTAVLLLLSLQIGYSQQFAKNLSKSDEDIVNPKKKDNPKTWIDRAELMRKVYDAPTSKIPDILKVAVRETDLPIYLKGEQQLSTSQKVVDEVEYKMFVYPDKELYLNPENGLVSMVRTTKTEIDKPLDKALDAYKKALELGGDAKKITEGLEALSTSFVSYAFGEYYVENYSATIDGFKKSLECSSHPLVGKIDTGIIYNVGFISMKNKDYKTAEEYYTKASEYGYQDGDIYASIYNAIRSQGSRNDTLRAGDILMKAYKKYPLNLGILGTLVNHYLGIGEDPKIILPILQDAQKAAKETGAENSSLYYVEGNLHVQLKDDENAIKAYNKAIEIEPDNANAHYMVGLLYYNSGVNIQNAANDKMGKEYDAELAKANEEFRKALVPLEKAYQINPNEKAFVDVIRSIYFRFRADNDEMKANYEKYKAIFDKME
ncbi:MAG: tetratricopeptide repeat protein [Prevotellaceae bacterium]|jgi:tetratricopeptide (TPR) repeat protein|nr:tetratricopeptide repeat protein [Prevotellaceae bacterium]